MVELRILGQGTGSKEIDGKKGGTSHTYMVGTGLQTLNTNAYIPIPHTHLTLPIHGPERFCMVTYI